MTVTNRYSMNSYSADAAGTANNQMTDLNSLQGILKDVYLPAINNSIYFDNKFTRMIEPATARLDATGRRIIGAFQTQRSAGVGPMTEGGGFRRSVPIDAFQGWEWIKYSNMYVEFTGPALATIQQGEGSYLDLVNSHIESLIESEKLNTERILMGNGTGILCTAAVTPVDAQSTIAITGPAFFDSQFLELGMWIEMYDPAATGIPLAGFSTSATDATPTTRAQIIGIARGNKRTNTKCVITLDRPFNATGAVANAQFAREGAYALLDGATSGRQSLEQNGLDNLVSDGADHSGLSGLGCIDETGNQYKYIWGKDRTQAANWPLKSTVHHIGDELDEDNMLEVLTESEYQHQNSPNLLVVTPRALLKYFGNSRDDRRFNISSGPMDNVMGFTGQYIQLGDKKIALTALSSVPVGKGFLINTGDFAFIRPPGMSGYKWLTDSNGSVLMQKETSDQKFASAVAYWNFTCQKPDKQLKLIGITE